MNYHGKTNSVHYMECSQYRILLKQWTNLALWHDINPKLFCLHYRFNITEARELDLIWIKSLF